MAARSDWQGAISFAGLFTAHVAAYGSIKQRRSISFRSLDPKHKQPLRKPYIDKDGEEVPSEAALKGIEKAPGQFVVLGDAELNLIANAGMSKVVEVDRFSPIDSVPWELALERFDIVPNEKVPGSDQPFNIIWNYLRDSRRAAVVQDWCPRSNSRPSTLVVTAGEHGMVGTTIRFATEVQHKAPDFTPQENEKAGKVIEGLVDEEMLQDFNLNAYRDSYMEKRQTAIDIALSGEVPENIGEDEAPEVESVPDLMAALEAKLAEKSSTKKAPAKSKTKTKAAA